MFGRVRASSISSLGLLEMERPPPKIIKHDHLSIYESTLLKLKHVSHCNSRCNLESTSANESCSMAIEENVDADADYSYTDSVPNLSSSIHSKQKTSKNMSILHFFSKSNKDVMDVEAGSSSSSIS